MKQIFISHSVFLSPDERSALNKSIYTVETIGISVPAQLDKMNKGPLTEIFCRYLITNEAGQPTIEWMPDGYKIFIDLNSCPKLLNVAEGGSEWLHFHTSNEVEKDGETYHTTHQVVIQDLSVLEKSTVCRLMEQYLAQKK